MIDILLEVTRASILVMLMVWLVIKGRSHLTGDRKSWNIILSGFALLLFGSVLDVTDNYPSLNQFVVIGDTAVEAFLEKFVGFLGGFLLVTIGLIRWLPSVKESEVQLQKSNQAKEEFLASMSHELRTPLTSIIGNSELLLDKGECSASDCPHQDSLEILSSIRNAGRNQLSLVNDILDMSKIESGKFTIDEAPYGQSWVI